MTRALQSLVQIASDYDAIVFDQWGVLHDGSRPYDRAVHTLARLKASGTRIAVLSNSGKRSAPNADRISAMGFASDLFECVMTSGEALWRDVAAGTIYQRCFYAIERAAGDAAQWASGLNIAFVEDIAKADAVLLMGLPDDATLSDWQPVLDAAKTQNLTVYCSNPDRKSPRKDGFVVSPGALAFAYKAMGGSVVFYGKPHRPIFASVEMALGTSNLLMIGDSLEHDIAGAAGSQWDNVLVQSGLYANEFAKGDPDQTLKTLVAKYGNTAPTFQMEMVQ
ncbi:MAG: TIGR01459 family HAD-type hydrolase [Pseudomonadota bacterium]